jgi:CopG family nickel-responsive transcriptional regulator
MQRITITIDNSLLAALDSMMEERGYDSRSEAVRDILRAQHANDALGDEHTSCVGTLTLVFDHGVRELAHRLSNASHAHHDLVISSSRVYLDHESCLEVLVLRGRAGMLQHFAQSLASQRGVRNSNLHLMPVTVEHAASSHQHQHLHV